MARITVEDCLENVDNRFHLVLLASRRAREIAKGDDPKVERENDKPTVIALREIADNLVNQAYFDNQPKREAMSWENTILESNATQS